MIANSCNPRRGLLTAIGCGLALSLAMPFASSQVVPSGSLADLSLEELGALSISAASKRTQPLFATPAAVTVLLPEDIRRSGHGSLAEAMRLVPGMHVARQDAGNWAIGVRGFNGVTSTKLLVMVDGRTMYSPFYAGVAWTEADLHLADLSRVEVVRGPGATVWGVNAVNGIVNIVSRNAHETQGALLALRAGSMDGLDLFARSGGRLGENTAYRVYARHADTRAALVPDAQAGGPDLMRSSAGFRLDRHGGAETRLTLQGEISTQRMVRLSHEPAKPERYLSDARYLRSFVLGKYERRFAVDNRLTVQGHFDFQDGSAKGRAYGLGRGASRVIDDGRSIEFDLTHAVRLDEQHDLVWGAGARRAFIDLELDDTLSVQEPEAHYDVLNAFVQDEIVLRPDTLRLTVGTKLEHHESNGAEVLPSLRLAWTPSERHMTWAAASRAVRAPSRSELDSRLIYGSAPATPTSPPLRVELVGDGTMREELLDAYELGWRFRPVPAFGIDIAVFQHEYGQLRNLAPRLVTQPDTLLAVQELLIVNDIEARGRGVETSIDFRLSESWRVTGHYTMQSLDARGGMVLSPLIALDLALPRHIWGLQSWWQLPEEIELILGTTGASALAGLSVPGHTRVDAQVIWRPRLDFELGFGLHDAFTSRRLEYFAGEGFATVPYQRNAYVRMAWRF